MVFVSCQLQCHLFLWFEGVETVHEVGSVRAHSTPRVRARNTHHTPEYDAWLNFQPQTKEPG